MNQDAPSGDAVHEVSLGTDDVVECDRAEDHQHPDDREAERDFVGDHLRTRAERTQQRPLVPGGPTRQHRPVNTEPRESEDEEHADVEVCDLKLDLPLSHPQHVAEGNDRESG